MIKSLLIAIEIFSTGSTDKVIFKNGDYYLVQVESEFILVFTGSNSLADWLGNLQFLRTNVDTFPKNWHTTAIAAWDKTRDYKIKYVIGYSRGAAIALIYSYYFNVQAIGFSTPNVSRSVRYWTIKPILIGCLNDPVRLVPPFYYLPGSYIAVHTEKGGHFWTRNKFSTEIKVALLGYY